MREDQAVELGGTGAASRWLTTALLLLSLAAGGARADDGVAPVPSAAAATPKASPPPAGLERKPEVPAAILARKPRGWRVTAGPLLVWDGHERLALGGAVSLVDFGQEADELFRFTPYRFKLLAGVEAANDGGSRSRAELDLPYLADTRFRLRAEARLDDLPWDTWFGSGDDVMRKLRLPGRGPGVRRFSRYQEELDAIRLEGGRPVTDAGYVHVQTRTWRTALALERDVWGGLLRPLLGLRLGQVDVTDLTGRTVTGRWGHERARATQQTTLLREQALAGEADGLEGGWDNALRLGFTLDSRDWEPDPASGYLLQLGLDLATRLLGSDYDYQRVVVSGASYLTVFARDGLRLILANRTLYAVQFGEQPFFSLGQIAANVPGAYPEGLGGWPSLRGYAPRRFVGRALVLYGGEFRLSLAEAELLGQHLRFQAHAFLEVGRAFSSFQLHFRDWRCGGGGGLQVVWDQATVIGLEVGASPEGEACFVQVGHAF